MTKTNNKNYYLGLDIGIGSVGWAIIGEVNGKHYLEDFGVRLFSVPEEGGEGKGKKTHAEKRREFRGKRRLLNRRYRRKEDLKKFFGKVFGDEFLRKFEKFSEKKKPTNLLKYDETKFFNPYVIRCKALDKKIELVELLLILIHINKNRGYRDFWENLDDDPEEKDKDDKKTKTAVQDTKKLFEEEENNYRSVAEMIVKNEKFRHSQYQNLLSPHNHNPEKIKCSDCRKEVKESKTKLIKENFSSLALAYCEVCADKNHKGKIEVKKDYKYYIFPHKYYEEETRKILEKQSEIKCYPQLKAKFPYTLWENGKIWIKELSAQEIIKAIIFRQRDFEDGPGPRDEEKRELWEREKGPKEERKRQVWKKHNRNITFTPFIETTGYCEHFPQEKRGWRCSLIYCCYQFINEFSKISGLEAKEEIHQKVFDWLLSPSGYQPIILSKEEKKSGKKRETFRKQLEKFLLDKLETKPNFPKEGIEFKTGFLDLLKRDSNFYSALRKKTDKKFYLNCKDYEKTIFYQIEKIIFENISPWRRKEKLDDLLKKHSLEAFENFLIIDNLKKYNQERSPASASFRYMIETIKAFLDGQMYGEFQAEFKKNKEKDLEKKLENSNNGGKSKKMWSPWMHPDLVKNSVVFRSFNQTRKILKNLFLSKDKQGNLNYPQGFVAINIETGRDLWNSEEERDKIKEINLDFEKEKKEIREKLKGYSNIKDNDENVKRYRLWLDQNKKIWKWDNKKKKYKKVKKWIEINEGSICLYCGAPLELIRLNEYHCDHIVPQNKWANDSLRENLTLTCAGCNDAKGDNLPLQFFWMKTLKEQKKYQDRVNSLYKNRNPRKHELLNLGDDWKEKTEGFVSRNINDTRAIATYLTKYIQKELNKDKKNEKTKVQAIRGSITSYFRKQIFDKSSVFHYKKQLRSLTHYHHAVDAIVLAHFKSRGHIQLLQDLTKLNWKKRELEKGKNFTQEQFDSLCREITEKWKKSKEELIEHQLFDKHTQKLLSDGILESIAKQKNFDNSRFFLIPDLKNIVEQRIPVQLEKVTKEPDWNLEEGKKIKQVIIEVKKVLTESEYYERVKDQRANIIYPYISYASEHKIKKEFIASEQAGYRKKGEKILPDICEKLRKNEKIDLLKNTSLSKLVGKISLERLNSEYGEKYKFLIVRDKQKKNNYTIWDTSKYAGFGLGIDGRVEKIKNIELFRKKRSGDRNWLTENYNQVIKPYDIFTFNYSEDLESELVKLVGLPLMFTGTASGNRFLSINIVGLVYDKEENLQTNKYEDKIVKISNAINRQEKESKNKSIRYSLNQLGTKEKTITDKISLSIKLLKIDILGKREK
ncbi:MAG: type II CRISPR RNA-guided endonuclease Cas9 [Candidatus Moeniiplasma glomeromycotorum]|nr:type II CRISPR RNA-guided endonuclease Cas9 [Candidatus Moeniiplasma glomeromycotorum]MCE8167704.1 type II CRISPR RNA-guided endonuclease Cas9 [Candidatus Moeniiplasma glomeromycotorum]MCE8169253.1 type II CRISPR RNA-guided endonuclease Cas9 [Candidatus Moeniiplasma glomeromycotorum]